MKLVSETHQYRSDIDGLRAIAVISVILFHLDKNVLPGGFIGVDIFFSISGFLITKIIYNQMLIEKFSFIEFYKRRIKRIAPAFFVCVIVTLIVGLIIIMKNDIKPLSRSVISSIFAFPNLYFYKTLRTGYFDNDVSEIPLLHMWSLGVEEQFYFFWPLTLLILNKFWNKHLVSTVIVALVASFIYAECMISTNARFSYYMILTRSGEMLLGAALALYLIRNNRKYFKNHIYQILALAGAALIAGAIIYTDSTHFPGISASFPCIGTIMIIYAGSFHKDCIINKLLSIKPIVFVGLISYSLYLWHWPIIVYANFLYFNELQHKIVILILNTILALSSYYFIEAPIRRSNISTKKTYILLYFTPAILVTMVCISLFNPKIRNYIAPVPKDIDKNWHTDVNNPLLAPSDQYSHYCFNADTSPNIGFITAKSCINGYKPSHEPNVLFFGDSHAMHHVDFLDVLGKEFGFSFRTLSRAACPPILNDTKIGYEKQSQKLCLEFRNMVKNHVMQYKYIILGGYWSNEIYPTTLISDLEETIKWLSSYDLKIIILGNVPLFKDYKNKCRKFRTPKFANCNNLATNYNVSELPHGNELLKN